MPGGERTETEAQTWGSQLLWLLYLCFCFRTSDYSKRAGDGFRGVRTSNLPGREPPPGRLYLGQAVWKYCVMVRDMSIQDIHYISEVLLPRPVQRTYRPLSGDGSRHRGPRLSPARRAWQVRTVTEAHRRELRAAPHKHTWEPRPPPASASCRARPRRDRTEHCRAAVSALAPVSFIPVTLVFQPDPSATLHSGPHPCRCSCAPPLLLSPWCPGVAGLITLLNESKPP